MNLLPDTVSTFFEEISMLCSFASNHKEPTYMKAFISAFGVATSCVAVGSANASSLDSVLVGLAEVSGQVNVPGNYTFGLDSPNSETSLIDLGAPGLSIGDQIFSVFNFSSIATNGPLGPATAVLNAPFDFGAGTSLVFSTVELFGRGAFVVDDIIDAGLGIFSVVALDPGLFAGDFVGAPGIEGAGSGSLLEIRTSGDTGSRTVTSPVDAEFSSFSAGDVFATLVGGLTFSASGPVTSESDLTTQPLAVVGATGDFVTSFGSSLLVPSTITITGVPEGTITGTVTADLTVIPSPAAVGVGLFGGLGLLVRRRNRD